MLKKSLTKVGSSWYLLITKSMLELSGITGDVQIDMQGDKIIIQAVKENQEIES